MGGVFAIAAVVDHFRDAVVKNPIVGQKSKDPQLREWHTKNLQRLPGLKFMRTLWVCNVADRRYFLKKPTMIRRTHRANHGVDDRRQHASDQHKPDHRQQPAGNDGPDDANDDVADQAETIAFDDLPGQPTCNRADDEPNDERFNHDDPPHC